MHPDLRAFGGALERSLGNHSREWLRQQLGVSPAAIGNYIAGTNQPGMDKVFKMEKCLGLPPGSLSRHLGYLPLEAVPVVTVPQAIKADSMLDPGGRRLLLALYAEATRSSQGRGSGPRNSGS
jgi:transcriptional regulator with XRE-family HTH domain